MNEPIWKGVDQDFTSIDKNMYQYLVDFLQEYFNEEHEIDDSKWCSSIDNAYTRSNAHLKSKYNILNDIVELEGIKAKAIPGGRYGCAQFLKVCGPPALRN